MAARSFYEVLTEAINDIAEHGFDSPERIARWQRLLREAAESQLRPESVMQRMLRDTMRAAFHRMVDEAKLLKLHPGVERFMLNRVKPQLRAELDRRILASADLIRLNRENAIAKTLQRFSGWSTSIPVGGSEAIRKPAAKANIRKSMRSLPFEERRVLIDQGHKLTAALSDILATDAGALAGIWHSHWREPGYQFREDHKERDQEVYVIRDNWALDKGLMKRDGREYTDQITKPGEEPFCRCYYQWIYNLRDLPREMLTEKGRTELARVRVAA